MFKLLIEVDEKGNIEVANEGKISPIIILGALRKIEHDLLMTSMFMEAEAAAGGKDVKGDDNKKSDI